MRSRKLDVSHDVVRIVRELWKVIFNVRTEEQMETVLGIKEKELEVAVRKIIEALPEKLFEPGYKRKLDEVKTICAREYVFFQAQEKLSDPKYENDLTKFIHILTRDIQKKF